MKIVIDDPTFLGVNEAALALSEATLSSTELVESSLSKIKTEGKELNAFIHVESELSKKEAALSDARRRKGTLLSPLDGVPIAVKDNIDVLGQPTTNGLGTQWLPSQDAHIVKILRNKGMVFIGKTNMHEAALGATTDNPHHGKCINPKIHSHTPGGSSGGSGSAVAAYLCPAALGTDTMGSVRVPAAYCGIVGFKPTQHFWDTVGVTPLSTTLDTIGPLARSVADIAVMTDVPLKSLNNRDFSLAVLDNFDSADMQEGIRSVYEQTKNLIQSSNVVIETTGLVDYEPSQARRWGLLISEVEASVLLGDLLIRSPKAFSDELQSMLAFGTRSSASRYFEALQQINSIKNRFLTILEKVKFVISPTTPQTSFLFSDETPVNQADFTALANFCGCPAISLPIKHQAGKKPMGLQIMAAPGKDVELLSVASFIEGIVT